jgi:hypothetical protein
MIDASGLLVGRCFDRVSCRVGWRDAFTWQREQQTQQAERPDSRDGGTTVKRKSSGADVGYFGAAR